MASALPGPGVVPALPLLQAAAKACGELPTRSLTTAPGLSYHLDLTADGMSADELRDFFTAALAASRKKEPIVETGNRYGVCDDFHRLNGELLMLEFKQSPAWAALSTTDQARAEAFLGIVLYSPELRSRNPLHPSVLDACVIGNLLNFPKHVLGLPFAAYATDGNEALSLVLYSYRQRAEAAGAPPPHRLLYLVDGPDSAPPPPDAARCAQRLGMQMEVAAGLEALGAALRGGAPPCAVVAPFGCEPLDAASALCSDRGVGLHLLVSDSEWRGIFAAHAEPVHYALPAGVTSVSIQEGMMRCGYSLYRDAELRDLHFDVALAWQTAYLSPNEGGSGASTPLFVDFCVLMLGWRALRGIASAPAAAAGGGGGASLQPTPAPAAAPQLAGLPEGGAPYAEIRGWAERCLADEEVGRGALEAQLLGFQRHFLGGMDKPLEVITTGGGTRSINIAFEAILQRARAERGCGGGGRSSRAVGGGGVASSAAAGGRVRVLTGNPHLAVERAERRFGFELVRLYDCGTLDTRRLAVEIRDPRVVAVYSQTLSYTDGISDDLEAILAIVEAENERRSGAGLPLVTLVNDSCLAFCVLVHNDGRGGRGCLRLLDLAGARCTTPLIVTLDAHKHLGVDKGVSSCVGSPGTLSHLAGSVRVGAQPTKGMLVRALADLLLVGVDGYTRIYRELAEQMRRVEAAVEAAGLAVVHRSHRAAGSSVISAEDPAGVLMRKLKRRGHSFASLFNLYPSDPARCQYGWSLSLTPYALRDLGGAGGGATALEVFLRDLGRAAAEARAADSRLATLFSANSLPGILLRGGTEELYLFTLLWRPGLGRAAASLVLRRLFTGLLDAGVVRSRKRADPLRELAWLAVCGVLLALALALAVSALLSSS